jgi:hypothetical protein
MLSFTISTKMEVVKNQDQSYLSILLKYIMLQIKLIQDASFIKITLSNCIYT